MVMAECIKKIIDEKLIASEEMVAKCLEPIIIREIERTSLTINFQNVI